MEAKDRLMELYRLAVAAGIVTNRKQFAKFISTAEGTELAKRGVSISPSGDGSMSNVIGSNNSVGLPTKNFTHEEEWFALVAEKDKQIDRLLSIIENLQK